MNLGRAVFNAGHAVGWTALLCSTALTQVAVTGSERQFQFLVRVWVRGLARGMGFEVECCGADKLEPEQPYIFVANHLSFLDILALFRALPRPVGFLAKRELRRVPLLGSVMQLGGHVFIDRSRRENALSAMAAAAEEVRRGRSLVIFPEGTRGRDDAVQPFKRGGFHLAMKAGVPVVPVGLRGTRKLMARGDFLPRSGRVEVHVGEPLLPGDFDDVIAFAAEARRRVAELAAMPMTSELPSRNVMSGALAGRSTEESC